MALTDPINRIAPRVASRIASSSQPSVEPPTRRATVIPFPSARGLLPVTLPHAPNASANASLRALLHSPLGVYVVSTNVVRDTVRAQLDIAIDDLDFTLHTLLKLVPVATIGRMQRHVANTNANGNGKTR